jgi:zinc transport system substrate-binding protein
MRAPQRLWRAPALALIVALGLALAGCSSDGDGSGPDRVQVVTAFYPLEFAVQEIGGSSVQVTNLTPPGVEPHDLELSPGQVRALTEADLVVYLGQGFQPAVEDAVTQLDESKTFDALADQELFTPAEEEASHLTESIGAGEAEAIDPHVWLDPTRMAAIAQQIETALATADPSNADAYGDRAQDLSDRLTELDDSFASGLAHCKSREVVTSHAAFAYLANRYDLTQISVAGLDPESEPSPARLAAIVRIVEERGITTIFSEELAPPEIAETLSRESGAVVKVLSPLETAPASGDYVTAMDTNLERLRAALDCD